MRPVQRNTALSDQSPKLLRLDHVQLAIPAGSEDSCRQFWGDLLGLVEIPKPKGLAGRGGLWFQLGEVELHLGVEADFRPAKKAHPAFIVRNIEDLAEGLTSAGYATRWDTSIADRRRFFTYDPFGNRLEFIAEETTTKAASA